METPSLSVEQAVRDRYAAAAQSREENLCCPIDYDGALLAVIPDEIIERDYGCGDPSRWARPGDTVLDLGAGGGKICFMAAQVVGATGRVIGVDMNADMLALAREHQPTVAGRIDFDNIAFHHGRIQDLALDLDVLESWLAENPVTDALSLARMESHRDHLRHSQPMIPDNSVDLVVSNCVLNLVRDADKAQMIQEIFRVLKPGGRIAISDIVSDEPVPAALKADPVLWSGCISGAFEERDLFSTLTETGFQGITVADWAEEPFAERDGIEFRSITFTAIKGEDTPCLEGGHAVVYRGPFSAVEDDDNHRYERGARTAVCGRTFRMLTADPYQPHFVALAPAQEIPEPEQALFACDRDTLRHPGETKGSRVIVPAENSSGCC